MRIAVTGHLGTIGTPLVQRLKAEGHDVTGIDLRHHHTGIRADVAEYRQVEAVFSKINPEMVYHLAAEFGRHNGEDYYEQVWRTNVIGTKNILRVQRELGFRLIFASSSEVYGERENPVLTEDLPLDPKLLTNDYAISKLVNESQIKNAIEQWGSQTMILRFFNAYGPGEFYHAYRSVVCLFTYRALKNIPYTVYRNYWRVFMHIDDMVDTLSKCARMFRAGQTINVGGTEYRSVEQLHEIIASLVDIPEGLVTFMPEDTHNVTCKKPDISKARAMLGHNPTIRLEDGVKQTIEWMRSVY